MIACLTSEDDNQLVRNATKPAALMSRFEALLRSKLDGPVYLTEICSELGIGERMLRYHCQEHLGMNPHRYLWLRRMQLAQQALRRADGLTGADRPLHRSRTIMGLANLALFGLLSETVWRVSFGNA
jgi:AraC-like DNA-binding protein